MWSCAKIKRLEIQHRKISVWLVNKFVVCNEVRYSRKHLNNHNIFLHILICQNAADILKKTVVISLVFIEQSTAFKKWMSAFSQNFHPATHEEELKFLFARRLPTLGVCRLWQRIWKSHQRYSLPKLKWVVITLIALFSSHLPKALSF